MNRIAAHSKQSSGGPTINPPVPRVRVGIRFYADTWREMEQRAKELGTSPESMVEQIVEHWRQGKRF